MSQAIESALTHGSPAPEALATAREADRDDPRIAQRLRNVLLGSVFGQGLPMLVFVAFASQATLETERFPLAFMGACPFALLMLLALAWTRTPAHPLMLGANLYVVLGGASIWLGLDSLHAVYAQLRATGMFIAVFVVGLLLTLWSRRGLVRARTPNAPSRRMDVFMLAAVALAGLASWQLRATPMFAGGPPFMVCLLLYAAMRARLQHSAPT